MASSQAPDEHYDFSSLSVKDLLDAREAYHVHLAHFDMVFATAIGRYLIRTDDQNSTDPDHATDPNRLGPRRLDNTVVTKWSWPCVLVFVKRWYTPDELRNDRRLFSQLVPSRLYLPDGRVVPTCVVAVDPDLSTPVGGEVPVFKSDLVGGGFPVRTEVQGKTHVGSLGCMVTDGHLVYALTNRHVVGEPGREIFAGFGDRNRRLGVTDTLQLRKRPFREIYPGWPGERVICNLDAGLLRIDDVRGWTAQAYGVGQIGDVWDLNVDTFRLDIVDCPLIAFGAASGPMQGRILGLFYRYRTMGGVDYITDLLIGPRVGGASLNNYPGDSGTLWFEDRADPPRNAGGAPIRRPVALEWGGQQLLAPGGKGNPVQLALGICLSTICRELDLDVIADWNAGHTEYWGEWGHVKVGAYATEVISDAYPHLRDMMQANAENIGVGDHLLENLLPYHKGQFAPLADVADLVWRFTRHADSSNHFADMDKPGPGSKTLLDLCKDPKNIDPDVWNSYYASIGEDDKRGALPIRVWQIYDEMVDYARAGKLLEFVCAGGIMAHYVGDACQPLHVSQYHHGRDPADAVHAAVHSVYETTMVAAHGPDLIEMIPKAVVPAVAALPGQAPNGHAAAIAVVDLMRRTFKRLPPLEIVDMFDAHIGRGQTAALWSAFGERTAACMQDGARTLARIWEGAWRAGGGEGLGTHGVFKQNNLADLYNRPNAEFLPAYKLNDLTTDKGRIIVGASPAAKAGPAKKAPARKAPAKRAPAKKAPAKKAAAKKASARKR